MSRRLSGIPAAPGIAVGPIWRYRHRGIAGIPIVSVSSHGEAEMRIREAANAAAAQLEALAARMCEMDRAGEAEIMEAQALMAVDSAIVEEAVRLVRSGHGPVEAVVAAAEASAEVLAALDDALLAARAGDVRDVATRIARNLSGAHLEMPVDPSIVVGDDLPPSLLAEVPAGLLLGVVLAGGSPTAHVAILARSRGIPAVVAASGLLDAVHGATMIAIDGESGEIAVDPTAAELQELADRQALRGDRDRAAASLRGRLAATADGLRVPLLANIRSPEDAARALEVGAEGVGLFRTEYLFMRRHSAPSEAEQVGEYRRAMAAFGPSRRVVVRMADIGGDKSIPYLGHAQEPNPFLGVRAIRLAHESRDLLVTQLRAIWRAAGLAGVTPHAMAAMVATVGDARLLCELRDEARAAVAATGVPCPERMITGVMIEVPSAALMAPELARIVDFFSIGTNDLTQYVLAADRGNPLLAGMQDALHPAVLRTIAAVVAGARAGGEVAGAVVGGTAAGGEAAGAVAVSGGEAPTPDAAGTAVSGGKGAPVGSAAARVGIPVAVCGELAGDPAGALVLVGLGVDELSIESGSMDSVRAALARVTIAELRDLAERSLAAPDAETVRAYAKQVLGEGR